MKVAIIIPCFGKCCLLHAAIEALLQQCKNAHFTALIYLVDNGSLENLSHYKDHVCLVQPGSNLLYFGAAYYVSRLCPDLDILVLLNQDVVINDKLFLRKLILPFEHSFLPPLGAVAPLVMLCKLPKRINAYGLRKCLLGIWLPNRFLVQQKYVNTMAYEQVEGISGCAFAISREVFDLFMSRFEIEHGLYNEDSSLNLFFLQHGLASFVVANCAVYHDYSPALFSPRKLRFWVASYVRGQIAADPASPLLMRQSNEVEAWPLRLYSKMSSLFYMLAYLMRLFAYKAMQISLFSRALCRIDSWPNDA